MRQLQNGGSIFNDDEEEIAVTTYITVNTSTLQTDMRVLRVQQNVDSRRQHAQSDDEPGAVAQLGARVELVVGPKVAGEEDLSRDLRACDAQTVIAGDRVQLELHLEFHANPGQSVSVTRTIITFQVHHKVPTTVKMKDNFQQLMHE
eukprot:gene9451-11195_t